MKTQRFLAYLPASPAGRPNKKFILVVFLGLLLTGGGFLIFQNSTKEQKPQISQGVSVSKPIIVQEISKDSDNDGLLDWEEILWKTDPNNADTDNDGTSDWQEIKESRDPLLKGNDKISGLKTPAKNEGGTNKQEFSGQALSTKSLGSLTEIISQQFFSDYLNLKTQKNGEALTETEKNNFINSFSDKLEDSSLLETAVIPPAPYIKSDIKIAQDSDQASIKEYGNSLALIIKKHFDPIPESELAIFYKAIQTKNPAEFEKMRKISGIYADTAKEISKLAIPQNIADNHLNLINGLANISEDIKSLSVFLNDPMTSLSALPVYKKNSLSAFEILRSINGYFSENQVVFENNEAGEYFKNYQ